MGKKALLYGGVAVLAVLLIGAAFVGGRLLSGGEAGRFVPPFLRRGGTTEEFYYGGEVIRPEELPDEAPTISGEVVSIEGKRITVRPPKPGAYAGKVELGELVEVVVTRNTKIWKSPPLKISLGKVSEQEVKEATLDDIKPGILIQAWGNREGDRVMAEVIFFWQ